MKALRPKKIGAAVLLLMIASMVGFSSNIVARTIDLDGTWEIVFDHHNVGRESGWHLNQHYSSLKERRTIQVPSVWELVEQDYEGVAFYRRDFDVPADWSGKVVRLQFGAVNYLSEVWLNDAAAGFHEGGFTPFEFRVDNLLKVGETNTLIVRVVGPIILEDKIIDGTGKMETPQWRGGICGGIWQSVRLMATDDVYVEDVFLEPKISDQTVTLDLTLNHTGISERPVVVEVNISEAKGPSGKVSEIRRPWSLRPGLNRKSWTIPIPNAEYWSPENPYLYRVQIRVLDEESESDKWQHRFGMRELTIRDRDFYLNGKTIYIKATFFEGLYPVGIAYPDSEAMARREIQLAKDAGFNMIRPWRRPPAPMWLDLADEMGVLVVGSPALECMRLPLSTPYLPSRVENEIRQAVLRDRNRTCLVQWELFNEVHRPILKQMMRPMALLARELDPTRLVLDESGGWAFGANIYLPYEYEPIKFNDIHNYPGPFINEEIYDGYLTIGMTEDEKSAIGFRGTTPGRNVVPGLMSFVSELGYGSLPDLVENNKLFQQNGDPLTPAYRYHLRLENDQKRALKESGFAALYPKFQQFCLDQQSIHGTANKRMIEAVRSNPEVDGYCIHALAAGDWILGAGLIDLWRNPKSYAYEATKAANQPRILSIRLLPRNVYAGKGATLKIIGVNELAPIDSSLTIEVISGDEEAVFGSELTAEWKSGISHLFTEKLDTRDLSGTYTVLARVSAKDGSIIAENEYDFDVFSEEALAIPLARVAAIDLDGSLTSFLNQAGINIVKFDKSTPLSVPVLVTAAKGEDKMARDHFSALSEFTDRGGSVVFIEGTPRRFRRGGSNQVESPFFPFKAEVHAAKGLWTCIPHLVHEHPIFQGLPVDTMMREMYENVWPTQTLRGLDGEVIVASIGFDWFSDEHKLHYSGPGESWWGADLAIISQGKGRSLISQLRIVPNLGKDPVADKLLYNIIRFVGK